MKILILCILIMYAGALTIYNRTELFQQIEMFKEMSRKNAETAATKKFNEYCGDPVRMASAVDYVTRIQTKIATEDLLKEKFAVPLDVGICVFAIFVEKKIDVEYFIADKVLLVDMMRDVKDSKLVTFVLGLPNTHNVYQVMASKMTNVYSYYFRHIQWVQECQIPVWESIYQTIIQYQVSEGIDCNKEKHLMKEPEIVHEANGVIQ